MKIFDTDFNRTIFFGQILGLPKQVLMELILSFPQQIENFSLIDKIKTAAEVLPIKSLYLEMLEEIFLIEDKKLKLKCNANQIRELWENERFLNKQRESLLKKSYQDWHELSFEINPCIHAYQSDWKWIVSERALKSHNLKELLQNPKGNWFFLFEKTGTFDEHLQSNILEHYISEYQNFILHLFKNPTILNDNLEYFYDAFEFNTIEEKNILIKTTANLIQEMVFKRWLIVK
jgi:hypothetical protein